MVGAVLVLGELRIRGREGRVSKGGASMRKEKKRKERKCSCTAWAQRLAKHLPIKEDHLNGQHPLELLQRLRVLHVERAPPARLAELRRV